MDLKLLQERARKSKSSALIRRKKLYRLARNLGFTTDEARILSGFTEELIGHLAFEKFGKK